MPEEVAASPSPAPAAPASPAFVCDCDEDMRSACGSERFYQEHEGKRYCVLHFPGDGKSAAFAEALRRKLDAEDFNFRGVWFPDRLDFSNYTFSAEADFTFATFSAGARFLFATFSAGADFSSATFGAEASFFKATFSAKADFIKATFGAKASFFSAKFVAGASFLSAKFVAGANFSSATFGAKADFIKATFVAGADFSSAIFKDYVRFAGDKGKTGFSNQSSLTLAHAAIEKPERVSFHTLTLRPHWFINVDAREFDFTNVEWRDLKRHGLMRRDGIKKVIEQVRHEGSSLHTLLARACRHLAVNAEENHRYEEAAQFRYWAMDVRRREKWRGFTPWKLSWWYWLASGYGERIFRAAVWLVVIFVTFAALYTRVGFVPRVSRYAGEEDEVVTRRAEVGEPLAWSRAMPYSLGVLTLQKPEPRPVTVLAQWLIIFETILGPLQAALLALAVRRKFMR